MTTYCSQYAVSMTTYYSDQFVNQWHPTDHSSLVSAMRITSFVSALDINKKLCVHIIKSMLYNSMHNKSQGISRDQIFLNLVHFNISPRQGVKRSFVLEVGDFKKNYPQLLRYIGN